MVIDNRAYCLGSKEEAAMAALSEALISLTAVFSTVLSFLMMWIWMAVGFAVTLRATIDFVRPLLPTTRGVLARLKSRPARH